jgi:hypothetical protein
VVDGLLADRALDAAGDRCLPATVDPPPFRLRRHQFCSAPSAPALHPCLGLVVKVDVDALPLPSFMGSGFRSQVLAAAQHHQWSICRWLCSRKATSGTGIGRLAPLSLKWRWIEHWMLLIARRSAPAHSPRPARNRNIVSKKPTRQNLPFTARLRQMNGCQR